MTDEPWDWYKRDLCHKKSTRAASFQVRCSPSILIGLLKVQQDQAGRGRLEITPWNMPATLSFCLPGPSASNTEPLPQIIQRTWSQPLFTSPSPPHLLFPNQIVAELLRVLRLSGSSFMGWALDADTADAPSHALSPRPKFTWTAGNSPASCLCQLPYLPVLCLWASPMTLKLCVLWESTD